MCYGLKKGEQLLLLMCFLVDKYDMKTSLLVSTTKNFIGISLPVL